tara:strand:- start:57749 stop:58024 length:276 start_codon:yes stop_codon:yes gene_type:complete
MDKLIYQRGEEAREPQRIELAISDDLTCKEFLVVCVRMAQVLGYHENTIKKTFGDMEDGDIKDEFEKLISKIIKKDSSVGFDRTQLKLLFD